MSTAVNDETGYLDDLQVQMEEIGLQKVPNLGHFCGYCYGRLTDGENQCRYCHCSTAEMALVSKVPIYVLRVYLSKRRREGLMVNSFAFLGLFLAVVLSGVIYFFLVGNWRIIALVVLLFSGWYLANLLGGWIGATIGYNWGRSVRDNYWARYLEDRRNGVAPDV
ncbi:MAG TPA: hypothetical protein VIO16_09935 [Dehalococcoidia bacterium]